MKASRDFVLREVAGEIILVPTGETRFSGLVTLNGIGRFIFESLGTETTESALLDRITAEYDVDRETAAADLSDFLKRLREIGALTE